jgi:hypothetical protein
MERPIRWKTRISTTSHTPIPLSEIASLKFEVKI